MIDYQYYFIFACGIKYRILARGIVLANFTFLNPLSGIWFVGNPKVDYSKISNVDLRYEHFLTGKELISFSLFYKYFDRPIEQVMIEGLVRTYQQAYELANAKSAIVGGVETELRFNIGNRLKIKALEDFTLYGNASIIRSRVNVSAFEFNASGRGVQGQAQYIFNAGIIYTEPTTKLSFSAFYNRVGERIAIVGVSDTTFASWWELPRDLVDVQISWQSPNKHWELRALLNDIFNQPTRIVQIYDGRTTYDENKDQIISQNQRGWRMLFTVAYRF